MQLNELVLHAFVVFCRIAGALMVVPGFSNARVPVRVRLFGAVVIAWAIAPMIPAPESWSANVGLDRLIYLIASETMTGAAIGVIGRIYLAALAFMATAVASYIGYGGMPGSIPDDSEMVTTLSALVTATAVLLFFVLGVHWTFLQTLFGSYQQFPIGSRLNPAADLELVAKTLSDSFFLGLQLSGPFLIYGVIINLVFGIVNRLIPLVPSFFISMPFLICGGLLLLHLALGEMMTLFMTALQRAYTDL